MLSLRTSCAPLPRLDHRRSNLCFKRTSLVVMSALTRETADISMDVAAGSRNLSFPILVNGCTGKMGKAVVEAAVSAGLELVPVSFTVDRPGRILEIADIGISIHDPSEGEKVIPSVLEKYPDVVVVDFTVPDAVNANAEMYCKFGLPFVMGTTGGNRELLYKTVQDANVYSVISPQMGKQVVAFLAAMEIMAEQFPGAFAGYKLEVMESHQSTKLDTSGTAKAVIACFEKLGARFDMNQLHMIRDPEEQLEIVGVPEEHLSGHAFHVYNLTSPDETVSFEFQHNVCGRSIYAEGSIDAAIFLHKKDSYLWSQLVQHHLSEKGSPVFVENLQS